MHCYITLDETTEIQLILVLPLLMALLIGSHTPQHSVTVVWCFIRIEIPSKQMWNICHSCKQCCVFKLNQCWMGQLLERIQISAVLFVHGKLGSDDKGFDWMTQHAKPWAILPFSWEKKGLLTKFWYSRERKSWCHIQASLCFTSICYSMQLLIQHFFL